VNEDDVKTGWTERKLNSDGSVSRRKKGHAKWRVSNHKSLGKTPSRSFAEKQPFIWVGKEGKKYTGKLRSKKIKKRGETATGRKEA